jgi:hypothetical protein
VAGGGRHDSAVLVVEVEVAAAAEAGEDVPSVRGSRGGNGCSASVSSVCGSSIRSVGPASPTQTVTIRPCASKVTEPQSALNSVDVTLMPRPSGPTPRYVSVW